MRAIVIAAIWLSVFVSFSGAACAEELSRLKVGAILCLTGDAAAVGVAGRNSISLALEKLPPDLRSRIEVYFEDDQLKPAHSISAFRKLQAMHDIDVVFNLSSGTGKALAPLTESAGIPLVSVASDPEVAAGRKKVVLFWVTPETEVKVLLQELKSRGYRKVARISTIQQGMLAVRKAFDKVNDGSVEVVLDQEYPIEVKDFKTYITRLRGLSDLDAVYVNLLNGQVGTFARQLRQADIKLPMFGVETMEDAKEVEISQGALIGAWYVNANDGSRSFMQEYKERFPGASFYGAANSFDAMIMIAAAFQAAPSREGIGNYLRSVKNFKGILGTYSATGDGRFDLPAVIKEVTRDGFRVVE